MINNSKICDIFNYKGVVILFHYYFSECEFYISYFIIASSWYFISSYIFIKSLGKSFSKDYSIKCKLILLFSGLVTSLIYPLLILYYPELAQTVLFFSTAISLSLINISLKANAIVISIISEGVTRILRFIASIFIGTIGWLIDIEPESIIIYTLIQLSTFILAALLLKSKRFAKGFQFFQNKESLGIGLIISGFLFIVSSIDFKGHYISDVILTVFFVAVIIFGFGLYFWIRKGITKHYREKLQLKSELYYKEQLEQKENEIEKLNQSNEFLAKIVHRDNHLMSSLDSSINVYFESGDKDFKDGVLREIQTLSKERGELIKTEQREAKLFPTTGNILIDGAINDLYIKAAAHGIDFDLSVSATVDEVIGKYISQTDLQTLICDHIKDAIIAVDAKNENNGKIFVELSMESDNYTITIFDSGVDFEIDTLAKLGKERVTTHTDNGGSGIGFMTTFETLRKSYASLIITEFANKTPFSKSVSIRFDGNTAFIIQSYRKEELQSALNRDDVILL